MKISCQSCQSKYNVADEKVQGKIVKIRCRKCGATIVVNASSGAAANGSAPAPVPTAPATVARGADAGKASAAGGASGEWHVSLSDNDQRTMSLTELMNAYNSGVVAQDTFVWTEGMQDWQALSEVEAVVSALHAAAAAPPAVAVGGYSYNPPVPAVAAPAYEAPAPAPVYERAAAYGGGLVAQAAVAPAAEPKRAAVVRRESRARDLFATRTGEEAQAGATASLDEDDSRLTGQRNENSVLFSLEHLTKNAEGRSTLGQTTASHDDSGIIDLKALAAKAESMRPQTVPDVNAVGAPHGFAPSAFTAPLGGLGPVGSDAVPKSRLPLLIGGGAGIGLLLVLGIVIGLKIGGAVSPAPAPTVAFPLPSATATATAEPSASAASTAVAQASAAAPAVASTAKPRPAGGGPGGAAWHGPGGGAKPPGAGAAAGMGGTAAGGAATGGATTAAGGAGGGTAPATAPPKKGDCGCNGDLMCMMKCSTH
jgi:predicted Zn finger-like uncharacterized protein